MSNLVHLGNLIYQTGALVGVVAIVVGTLRTWLLDDEPSSHVKKLENECVQETTLLLKSPDAQTLTQPSLSNASVSIASEKTRLRLRKASLSTTETCATLSNTTTYHHPPIVSSTLASTILQTEHIPPEPADSSLQDFLFYYDTSFQPQTTYLQPVKQEVITKQSNDSGKCLSMPTLNSEASSDNHESSAFLNAISHAIVDLSSRMTKEITPAQCERMKHIVKLDLSRNSIKILPDAFGSLASLTSLCLKENSLSELPDSFRNLCRLEFLDLCRNNLTHLGSYHFQISFFSIDNFLFSQMSALSNIDLSKNRLRSIPYSLGACFKTLTALALDDNPLDSEIMSLVQQSKSDESNPTRSLVSKSRSASLDSQVRPSIDDFFKKRESSHLSELGIFARNSNKI